MSKQVDPNTGARVIEPHKAVDWLIEHAELFAKAKANRVYLEEFRKSKKALLMKAHADKPIGVQEREAYSHPEYMEHLKALETAIEMEETERWMLVAAQARLDVWRTQSANDRATDRATQ